MIINKYTKHSIFSLPQIFYDTFTKYDLKNSEFVNMYTSDMNNPLLSNHIFLVFHNTKTYLIERLKKHRLYYCDYTLTIDRINYRVFAFNKAYSIHSIVNKIDLGLYERLGYQAKLQILNFWHHSVASKGHEDLINPRAQLTKPGGESIAIQDLKYRKAPTAKTEGALL